jgi:hypothetical protein
MFELRVEHSFPAGHHLRDYAGKCATPHGHNYRVQLAVTGPKLNPIGLLLDFSDLKKALRAVAETLRIVACQMENRVANDHIREGVLEGHVFNGFHSKIRNRQRGRQRPCEGADAFH